ncbi:unnamed protein product [Brugia timori]|uniref:Uncharacterized protein n=1 Tax=Brugia timori TaxID=42155 RepID=A0A3P7U2Q2_9BILA|nr:unnamed protein product [Brugia timori]
MYILQISGKDQRMVKNLRKTAANKFNKWFCSDSSRYQGTTDGNQNHQEPLRVTEEMALLESNVISQSVAYEVSLELFLVSVEKMSSRPEVSSSMCKNNLNYE